MRVTRGAAIFLLAFYALLWAIALHGASTLVPVLAVPLILAVLVAVGVAINRFVGITPRAQHFVEPEPEPAPEPGSGSESDSATLDEPTTQSQSASSAVTPGDHEASEATAPEAGPSGQTPSDDGN